MAKSKEYEHCCRRRSQRRFGLGGFLLIFKIPSHIGRFGKAVVFSVLLVTALIYRSFLFLSRLPFVFPDFSKPSKTVRLFFVSKEIFFEKNLSFFRYITSRFSLSRPPCSLSSSRNSELAFIPLIWRILFIGSAGFFLRYSGLWRSSQVGMVSISVRPLSRGSSSKVRRDLPDAVFCFALSAFFAAASVLFAAPAAACDAPFFTPSAEKMTVLPAGTFSDASFCPKAALSAAAISVSFMPTVFRGADFFSS